MRLSLLSGLMAVGMAALILAGGAMAVTNSVSLYTDDFEDYLTGSNIANAVNGEWHAAADTHMIATNSPVNTATSKALPDSAHTMVAKLDTEGDSITNHLGGTGVDNVWLNMNIQMVPSDSEPTSFTNDTQVQTAVYMGTNGQLNLYHSTLVDFTPTFGSNVFTELTHTAMETSSWHRLTVAMDYKSSVNGWGGDIKFVQVTLDGSTIAGTDAWVDPSTPAGGTSNGTWFICANQGTISDHINMALLSGTGYLDDFAVTNSAPTQASFYTNGVPGWWLAGYVLEQDNTVSGALYNVDNDIHPAWAEWLLGTDPTVSNSFQLMATSNGGTNTLVWVADGTMDDSAPGVTLHKSTNLLDGYTSTVDVPRTAMDAGTNEWDDTTGGDAMYRLGVSTD